MSLAAPVIESVHGKLAPILDALSEHIGCEFVIWINSDVDAEIPSPWSLADLSTAAAQALRDGECVIRMSEIDLGICVRLPRISEHRYVAVGNFTGRDEKLVRRLAHTTRLLIEQERQADDQSANLDSFMEMLSYGLEEQVWLRSLAQHIKLCSARRSLVDVVGELLPSLKDLVDAESIGFVRTGMEGSQGSSSLWRGRDHTSDVVFHDWLADFSDQIYTQPIVQNGESVSTALQAAGINSICAVQVGHGDTVYGWLVGARSEGNFGTVEAGLMEAATVMLATHGQNVDLLHDRENLIVGIIRAIASAVDARDPYTRGHSERVGRYGRRIAAQLGLSANECNRIYLAGLLHDVGKIGIPDAILLKPGRLTEMEYRVIRLHPEIGERIVAPLPQLSDLLPGILHHHESFDGTGYPHRLAGEAIPLMGRILAVADTYDALTSNRTYREGKSHDVAVGILRERAGIQWDPTFVDAMLSIPEDELFKICSLNREDAMKTNDLWLRGGAESICGEPRGK